MKLWAVIVTIGWNRDFYVVFAESEDEAKSNFKGDYEIEVKEVKQSTKPFYIGMSNDWPSV